MKHENMHDIESSEKDGVVTHLIPVEHLRRMEVVIDPYRRTVAVTLPGNYDAEPTLYHVENGGVSLGGNVIKGMGHKGKVMGTTLSAKRNLKRKGSPKGTVHR